MIARIIGAAIAGWLLAIVPLAIVDTLSLAQSAVDPSATAIAGVGALGAGILLGGLAAGLLGGRRGGAIGGAVAGALLTVSLVGLEYWLQAHNTLPVLVAEHPVRTFGALIFIGALLAGVALGVAALLALRAARAEKRAAQAFATARSEASRSRPMGSPANQPPSPPRGAMPAQRVERDWRPDPRPTPPSSAPRAAATRPVGRQGPPSGARYDERANQGYDEDRRTRAPERW